MEDEHFSYETVERFFRSELSRGENRAFVRHLLRQCQRCSRLVKEVAYRLSLQSMVGGEQGTTLRFDPASRQKLQRLLQLVGEEEARQVRSKRPARAGLR